MQRRMREDEGIETGPSTYYSPEKNSPNNIENPLENVVETDVALDDEFFANEGLGPSSPPPPISVLQETSEVVITQKSTVNEPNALDLLEVEFFMVSAEEIKEPIQVAPKLSPKPRNGSGKAPNKRKTIDRIEDEFFTVPRDEMISLEEPGDDKSRQRRPEMTIDTETPGVDDMHLEENLSPSIGRKLSFTKRESDVRRLKEQQEMQEKLQIDAYHVLDLVKDTRSENLISFENLEWKNYIKYDSHVSHLVF